MLPEQTRFQRSSAGRTVVLNVWCKPNRATDCSRRGVDRSQLFWIVCWFMQKQEIIFRVTLVNVK
jgi:hypothetical protein